MKITELSLKAYIGIASTLVLIALVGMWSALVRPLIRERATAHDRTVELQRDVEKARTELRALEIGPMPPPVPRDAMEERIPAERLDKKMIERLTAAAKRASAKNVSVEVDGGLKVEPLQIDLQSKKPATKEPYSGLAMTTSQLKHLKLNVSAHSSYREMVAFLGELAKEPRLISVESLSLTRDPPGVRWTVSVQANHW